MIREIYGKKVGMTQIFDQEGDVHPVTLLEVEPVCILEKMEYSGKTRVKIGVFPVSEKKATKLKKPLLGYFKKLGVGPYKLIKEVEPEPGVDFSFKESQDSRKVGVEIFAEGELVAVRAKSKGKGFTGGMKRHGWSGQPKSHGSTSHRRIGSVGSSAYPSRIIKGLGMPGHMGDKFRTVANLKVVKADKNNNLLFVEGSVPGSRGTIVMIKRLKAGK